MADDNMNDISIGPDGALSPEEFEKLSKFVSRAVKDMMKSLSTDNPNGVPYGFNIKIDKDGVPIIERVKVPKGQMPQMPQPPYHYQAPPQPRTAPHESAPLVDVSETQKMITVTMEMRGVEKDSITLSVGNRQVSVRSATRVAQATQTVALPHDVNPASAKAHYRNGILEIRMNRSKPLAARTINITVE